MKTVSSFPVRIILEAMSFCKEPSRSWTLGEDLKNVANYVKALEDYVQLAPSKPNPEIFELRRLVDEAKAKVLAETMK